MGCHAAVRERERERERERLGGLARQQRRAGDAAKPLGGKAPAGHMRRAGAGICTSRETASDRCNQRQRLDRTLVPGFCPRGAVTSQRKRAKARGPSRHCSAAEEGKERAVPAAGQPFMAEPDFGTGKNVVLPFEELRRREERYRGRQIDAANRRISPGPANRLRRTCRGQHNAGA